MLARTTKQLYFALLYYPMRINAWRHRLIPLKNRPRKAHLGPGKSKYLDDWTNVDANFMTAKVDIWANIEAKLPFQDGHLDAIYSHHVIEHLTDARLPFHFVEMYRTLRSGGVIRIAGPNGDTAIRKFLDHDLEWFSNFPDNRKSIGGRFANFLICGGDHLTILTETYLTELAEGAGFTDIHFCRPIVETNYPEVFDERVLNNEWESAPESPHTLVMEAKKPGAR